MCVCLFGEYCEDPDGARGGWTPETGSNWYAINKVWAPKKNYLIKKKINLIILLTLSVILLILCTFNWPSCHMQWTSFDALHLDILLWKPLWFAWTLFWLDIVHFTPCNIWKASHLVHRIICSYLYRRMLAVIPPALVTHIGTWRPRTVVVREDISTVSRPRSGGRLSRSGSLMVRIHWSMSFFNHGSFYSFNSMLHF